MDVCWRDLNNVRAPGDYPFRDGTITVTFAEIAIWKDSPGARFQLMRKHPLQERLAYALGRQVDEKPVAAADTELIYTSGNGDSWSLGRDPVSGAAAVMHRPNRQSGGQVSWIEIDRFLRNDPQGPEGQALRQLIEKRGGTATVLIAYDIHPPAGEAYDELIAAIKALGTWWHHLETIWIVKCNHTPAYVKNQLGQRIGSDDQLLVLDISGDTAEWLGINETGAKWLTDNVHVRA
jgi:hypothetical protein